MLHKIDVIDLSATDALLAVLNGKTGTLVKTPFFARLEATIDKLRPSLLILDALADLYGGDENVRVQVRQFITFLRRLCSKYSVTIVLVAHPSLAGMASDSGISGNTGWNNSVRCRLYLKPVPCLRRSGHCELPSFIQIFWPPPGSGQSPSTACF